MKRKTKLIYSLTGLACVVLMVLVGNFYLNKTEKPLSNFETTKVTPSETSATSTKDEIPPSPPTPPSPPKLQAPSSVPPPPPPAPKLEIVEDDVVIAYEPPIEDVVIEQEKIIEVPEAEYMVAEIVEEEYMVSRQAPQSSVKPSPGNWSPYEEEEPEIFEIVEEMPVFPGGDAELIKYLYNNIQYPATAKENNIEGLVVIQFLVNEDGSISNSNLVRDIGEGCGKIALDLVNKMPQWKPGKQRGQNVKVVYTLPVRFSLEDDIPVTNNIPDVKSDPMPNRVINRPNQFNTEDYDEIIENEFLAVSSSPLSTFSIDVDAAAYSNVRRMINYGQKPRKSAVRIEEMINYFNYNYPAPTGEVPFNVITEMAACPWNSNHKLLHIGLKGKEIEMKNLPPSNLVFLIDVSGSMSDYNKLPLLKESFKLLTQNIREQDKVAIVVYAGASGIVLPSTSGNNKNTILQALNQLQSGGSTAGADGIELAYQVAKENFIKDGNNRVILATDGDFNVGVSSDGELVKLIEQKRKQGVFLSVLGFGMGNYKDNKMQKLANKGNGNHYYIDGMSEAKKVLGNEFGGTLFTIAKDVKFQLEFNPAKVAAYRLIGYENRKLQNRDFNDDTKDAGELGAGHTVTALYEIIPAGTSIENYTKIDPLKYQQPTKVAANDDLLTVKLRYKQPDKDESKLVEIPVPYNEIDMAQTSEAYMFSASVAELGLLLRESAYKANASFSSVIELANKGTGNDRNGYRAEYISLVKKVQHL